MFILRSIALSSALIIVSTANADFKQDIQNFTGFYKAKTSMSLKIEGVGVMSRCDSAVYEDSIMKISYDESENELKVRKQYEYLSYPFDKDDANLIDVADSRDSIPLVNSEGRRYDHQSPRLNDSRGITSTQRAYMRSNFEVSDKKLEASKVLVPKKIGGVVKSIQHKYVLKLNNTKDELSMKTAAGGARILGLDFSSGDNCQYERISEGEYLKLSSDYDYRRSVR